MLATTNSGRAIAVLLLLGALAAAGWSISRLIKPSAVDEANNIVCIDAETGKTYHLNKNSLLDQAPPFACPDTGKNTLYTAETCYWNADGSVRQDPSYVLLNSYTGQHEPTFCPDCGRLVRGHNPAPRQGATPPPTKDEYQTRYGKLAN